MLVSAATTRLAFSILLGATSMAIADPPGVEKPPVDQGGVKVDSIDGKVPSTTDCVADHTCKKAHTQGSGTQPNTTAYKAPPRG
jgi:hypothetical protein